MLAQRLDGRDARGVECLQGACPECAEVLRGIRLLFPKALRLLAQCRQPCDLWFAQACMQCQWQARQQMVHGVQHAADVRLRDRIAARRQATGQFLLAEYRTLLFIEFLEAAYGQGAFDKAELGMQVVFGEMTEERAGLINPWFEQAVEVEETLIGG